MATVGKIVSELVRKSPFIEEALADNLINVSSLARKMKPDIEKVLGKEVQEGAIIMAINRMEPSYYHKINIGLKTFIKNLGDIIVRSNLDDYTFYNSETLINKKKELLSVIDSEKELFCTFSQGVYETTIIVSSVITDKVERIFKGEKLLAHTVNLSSITIKLPEKNIEVSGLYYYIFKKLAWEGINVIEVISTTNEFTVVIDDQYIDRAFSVLKNLKEINA